MALIRRSTVLMDASEEMRSVLRRYSIPALYAVWEGFVTFALGEFARRINNKHTLARKSNCMMVRHSVYTRFNLANISSNPYKQAKTLSQIFKYLQGPLQLSTEISTNSNVNYEELVKLMSHYGADLEDDGDYKSRLSKFLSYRNKIAHGNNTTKVSDEIIREFATLVDELMKLVVDRLDVCLKTKGYLKSPFVTLSDMC